MRRLIIEEPTSKAAVLSRQLAVFSLAVALVGFLAVRRGLDLLAVLGGALVIAAAAILAAILAFVVIWRQRPQGSRAGLRGACTRAFAFGLSSLSRATNHAAAATSGYIDRSHRSAKLFPLARGADRPRRQHAAQRRPCAAKGAAQGLSADPADSPRSRRAGSL